jgi:sigma-B regulation protein RsbU (phosphoserine phosphatase)
MEVRLLLEIAETLNAGDGFETGLGRVLDRVARELRADACGICFPEGDGNGSALRVVVERIGSELQTDLVQLESGLRCDVLRHSRRVRVADVLQHPDYEPAIDRPLGIVPRALLAVPLRVRGETTGVLYALRQSPHEFDQSDEDLLAAIGDKLAIWVQNDRLLRELRSELSERQLLLDVSRHVGQTIELDRVLSRVFEALRPVVPFDAAAIFLADPEGGNLEVSAQHGYDNPAAIDSVPEGQGIIGRVRRELRGVLIDDVAKHDDYLEARPGTRSEMAVPIVSGGRAIGVINLESDKPHAYDERSLRIAELIAAQVASAIVNARLHASRLEQSQVDHELGLAREIQLSLLPPGRASVAGLDVAAVNVPSSAVGGDYYDYVVDPAGHAFLVIADVSGHGLSAALLTASMRTGFRLLARQTTEPAEIARRLGEVLFEGTPGNQFVAAVIAVVDLESGLLRYCNAGHVPPVAVAPDGGQRRLFGGGPPLGLLEGSQYTTTEITLVPGELLVFYTDGIPEAENEHGDELGMEPLEEFLRVNRNRGLDGLVSAIRRLVRTHRARRGGHLDDVTLLTARWHGPGGEAGEASPDER